MLRVKLPVADAPPRMSLFWSVPWPHMAWAKAQKDRTETADVDGLDHDYGMLMDGDDCYYGTFGKEPKWEGARKIMHKGENIRVFPHEFSEVSIDNMMSYVGSGSHYLVPDTVVEQEIINEIRGGTKRVLYEQALLDGCNAKEALLTAMGVDVTGKYVVPAIGWYRIRPEYGLVFCTHEELNLKEKHEPMRTRNPELD